MPTVSSWVLCLAFKNPHHVITACLPLLCPTAEVFRSQNSLLLSGEGHRFSHQTAGVWIHPGAAFWKCEHGYLKSLRLFPCVYNRDGDGPWKAFWLASYQLYPRRWLTQASLKDHQQQHHLGLCYNRNAIPDLPRQTLWRQSPVFCLNKPSWGCWCSLWSTSALSYC